MAGERTQRHRNIERTRIDLLGRLEHSDPAAVSTFYEGLFGWEVTAGAGKEGGWFTSRTETILSAACLPRKPSIRSSPRTG